MLDKNEVDLINNILSKLIEYVETGRLQTKFERFVREEIEENVNTKEKYLEVLYAYIFDQKVDGNKTPLELYLNDVKDMPEEERELASTWKTSVHSIFQVNKTGKDSFYCYNLVNENDYEIKTISNFLNYKRISINNYIFCRIIPFKDYHVLLGNLITFPNTAKKEMLEMATMVQIENPAEMFKDNEDKLAQIYERNAIKYQKFYDFFGTNQIFTTGEHINYVIAAFTAFYEFGEKDLSLVEGKLNKADKFYFNPQIAEELRSVSNLDSYISNYADCHDVGIVIDEKEGLSILPYYATFIEIFANKDFKSVENYKECVMFYLEEDTISPFPFIQAITSYAVNSVNVFEDVLDQPVFSIEEDFEELMEDYKYDYIYNN
ncbi:MAG: hypothetical protein AB7V50_11215, partial [Vampirovibrionia bacterium]